MLYRLTAATCCPTARFQRWIENLSEKDYNATQGKREGVLKCQNQKYRLDYFRNFCYDRKRKNSYHTEGKVNSITLQPLQADDKEQFVLDNQEAFRYGAIEEFGLRYEHYEEDGEIMFRFEKMV